MKTTKVKERITQELLEIRETISTTESYLKKLEEPSSQPYQDALIMAISLCLHSFYTGVERIFQFIARLIDYVEPTGENWHQKLLEQMTLTVPDVRFQVISESTQISLDEFRRFRHVVRSVYAYKLEIEPVLELANKATILSQTLEREVNHFLESLPK